MTPKPIIVATLSLYADPHKNVMDLILSLLFYLYVITLAKECINKSTKWSH